MSDEEFDIAKDESEGTRKFLALAGPVLHTLEQGSILIVDEFEARLHPNLTKALLSWFHGPANTRNAQLILTTHDTGLMDPDLLRRDQIWFCEKDTNGATRLYSLAEFDPQQVRNNTKFNRQYLLHFVYRSTGIGRQDLYREVGKHIQKAYDKADKSIYGKLLDRQDNALRIARRLYVKTCERRGREGRERRGGGYDKLFTNLSRSDDN